MVKRFSKKIFESWVPKILILVNSLFPFLFILIGLLIYVMYNLHTILLIPNDYNLFG